MIRAAFFLAAGGAGEGEQRDIALRRARRLSSDTLLILPVPVTVLPVIRLRALVVLALALAAVLTAAPASAQVTPDRRPDRTDPDRQRRQPVLAPREMPSAEASLMKRKDAPQIEESRSRRPRSRRDTWRR